jgi:DNA-binding transcriptional ArsR family regulator
MSKRTLSPCDLARALHERGANVIPLLSGSKEPAGRWAHWATHPQDWPDVERLFAGADPHANIAALGGIHSAAVGDDWGYLALLDCDSREALDMGRALVKATLGADSLTSVSARGGHIWLRTPWPLKSARWAGGELRGYRSYVVAPGSVHPSGILYRWANDGAEILRCDTPLPGVPWAYVERDRIPRLAAAIMRADERVLSRYATRSEIDWALILSLTNAGASFERVRACYIASKHPKHLDPSRRDFEKRLLAEYLRAKELEHKQEYAQAREQAERVKAWALSAEFKGTSPRTREVDRRVLLAHAERAIKAGKSEWHLSLRDVVLLAQVTLMTAHRATQRLINAGLLKRKRGFVGECAQTYVWGAFVPKEEHLLTLPPFVSKCSTFGTPDYAAHPAFEHCGRGGNTKRSNAKGGNAKRTLRALLELRKANARRDQEHKPHGLGRYAGRIFQALAELGEANERQVAERAGYTLRTAERHLSAMLELQLVGYDPSRRVWWAYPERLDAVACYLETHYVPAERRARIERDRAKFRRRLSSRAR